MDAGKKLDIVIARLMGLKSRKVYHRNKNLRQGIQNKTPWLVGKQWRAHPPKYSTNISAAWAVAQRIGIAVVPKAGGWEAGLPTSFPGTLKWAKTAPHAICLAAIQAAEQSASGMA